MIGGKDHVATCGPPTSEADFPATPLLLNCNWHAVGWPVMASILL